MIRHGWVSRVNVGQTGLSSNFFINNQNDDFLSKLF
jgi:hypothetical protein